MERIKPAPAEKGVLVEFVGELLREGPGVQRMSVGEEKEMLQGM